MIGGLIVGLTRVLVGGQGLWFDCAPTDRQAIYFANHSSHLDTILIWATMPPELRRRVRPVAAADYWGKGRIQRHIALKVLNAVLIDRTTRSSNPLAPLEAALHAGDSLILFPEGTRGNGELPGSFKPGLYHLARAFPEVDLVPVYLDNLRRALPKGSHLPVPLNCVARFGCATRLGDGEAKASFLDRTRAAVVSLA
ncbi:MAG: 1-acyl-sn-glycerol-3-phosphate acyltransferase [Sphingomonas sp.]|uniref:lysophospholipid acyltransferase family protein n=1 Tax=Sphingomonas sp. TaxID=28214 RepID=UPI0017F9759B|nr:lysophospholipid acyltransferase family protein [Sphingomonas sp.]MBA3666343.1 1-acyl-sn-glycerol-3-phosphate acyltransferase [Sphingomonas sp.]